VSPGAEVQVCSSLTENMLDVNMYFYTRDLTSVDKGRRKQMNISSNSLLTPADYPIKFKHWGLVIEEKNGHVKWLYEATDDKGATLHKIWEGNIEASAPIMIENQINQKKGRYQKLENNCQLYVQQLFTKLTGQVSSLLSLKEVYDRSTMEFCSEWLKFTLFCLQKMNWTTLKEAIIQLLAKTMAGILTTIAEECPNVTNAALSPWRLITNIAEFVMNRWNQWRHSELVDDNDEQSGRGQDRPGSCQVP